MTSRKNGRGTATRWASEESISPRCVLDDCTTPTTTSQSTATNTTSASSAAATTSNTITATYTAPPTPPTPAQAGQQPPPPPQQQSWKAVAEAWRSRSRRIPSLRPTMSSALRRLSLRRADQQHDDARDFCVLMPSLRTFSLGELKRATGNFSGANVVGRGGFAKVYRGRLPGGELVAVKRLTAAGGGRDRVEGFLAELGHVVNVSHPNIARLVGVGVDGGEHLVFPFSRLGCLSGLLHGGGGGPGGGGAAETMTWAARYRVAVGTARGLEYLHERCARRIVHRDIKPANILLMDNYEPLICDFGLARWLPAELTHLQVTVFEGTFGYVPPEYTSHGVFSEKADVFALGVVLLELLTGRRAVDAAKLSLVAWARQFLDNDKDDEAEEEVLKMADPALGGRYDGEQLRDVAWAAKLCVQTSPDHRPRMSQVVRILQGAGSPRRRGSAGQNRPEFQEQHHAMMTNRCDAARHTDDLSRHKALAFDDLDGESSCASLVSPRADVPAAV